MKLVTTTLDLSAYADSYSERIALFTKTPFRYLDMDFSHFDFLSSDWEKEILNISRTAEKNCLQFVQSHAANFDPLSPEKDRESELLKLERTLEACKMLGIPNTVVHAPRPYGDTALYPNGRENFFDYAKRSYALLFPAMERTGVQVLAENSAEVNMLGGYYFMTGQEMYDFLEEVGHPLLQAVWDIGHANLRGNDQYKDILALGGHLKALHIQDNDGNHDEHTAPFQGTTNMDAVMQALLKIDYKGYFTFESNNFLLRAYGWPYRRRSFHGEFPNLLHHPSLELKLKGEQLLYEIGKFILESYHVFEE